MVAKTRAGLYVQEALIVRPSDQTYLDASGVRERWPPPQRQPAEVPEGGHRQAPGLQATGGHLDKGARGWIRRFENTVILSKINELVCVQFSCQLTTIEVP